MSRLMLPVLVIPLLAATPPGYNLTVPAPGSSLPSTPPQSRLSSPFQPAPLPNRDVELTAPRASNSTSIAPTLFTRPDQYRGEGFNKGSSAQSEQEKRVKPGAGFSLHMPFSPD